MRKYLSIKACETIVNALVTTRLDYCNSFIWFSSLLLSRLQRVQNSKARLIHNVSRTTPSSLLISLHWLYTSHHFQILLITYKAVHSLDPQYITQLIKVKSPAVIKDLRMPSSSNSKTLGNRSFSLAAPVEWNNLPAYIRNAKSLTILITHLFRLTNETALITPHEFIHTYACTKLLTLRKHTYISNTSHIYRTQTLLNILYHAFEHISMEYAFDKCIISIIILTSELAR